MQAISASSWATQRSTVTKITYHGDQPLEDAYIGLYSELIAGEWGDDLAGTDSTLNLLYVYDDDNEDWYYASGVPAIGMTMIRGPVADLDLMDNDGDGVIDESGERLNITASIINNDVHENYGPEPSYSHLSGGCGGQLDQWYLACSTGRMLPGNSTRRRCDLLLVYGRSCDR